MQELLIFGVTLLAAVMISELADRSVVSLAVLFLVAGFVGGSGVAGWMPLSADSPIVAELAELALVAVLFTDGMKLGWPELREAARLPGRALLLGLPLTLVATAAAARWIAGQSWINGFLIGTVLSPTDPVFAAAIIGRKSVPQRLRRLLNVESGMNDGLALPILVGLLAAAAGAAGGGLGRSLAELAFGVALGVALPWAAVRVERWPVFKVAERYEPFFVFSIGVTVFALARLIHANEFLAMFAAGVTMATMRPELRAEFHRFGDRVAELLKLAAVLVFGAMISPQFLVETPARGYVFAAVALAVARPVGLALALAGAEIGRREKVAALWFGPKGFGAVVYGLMVLKSGVRGADEMFHLIAIVIAASIIAHSSTDVVVARWLRRGEEARANEAAREGEAGASGG
jgi:NhaP-type Na+/H+ or K+/H+ antiporter